MPKEKVRDRVSELYNLISKYSKISELITQFIQS